MCDAIDPDSNIHKKIFVVCTIERANLKNILNLNKSEVLTFPWIILTAEVWPVTLIS